MEDSYVQLGIGGVLALLVIKEVLTLVFNFLKDRKNNSAKKDDTDLQRMVQQVHDLHQWHSLTDSEGVKVWYVRRSLEEAIRELSNNLRAQTDVLQQLVRDSQETRKVLDRLKKDAS